MAAVTPPPYAPEGGVSGTVTGNITGNVTGNVAGTSCQVTTFRVGTGTLAARGAAVTAPTGGSVVDVESRAAVASLISRLQAFGLIA